MTMLHIGNKIDMSEAAAPLATAICEVLASISEHHIDRETGIRALDILGRATGGPTGTTVSGCTFTAAEPAIEVSGSPEPTPFPFRRDDD